MWTAPSIRQADRVGQRLPYSTTNQRALGAKYLERVPSNMTLAQVGRMMGLTRERVRQIEQDALNHLRYWIDGLENGTLTMEDLRRAQEEQERNPGKRTWPAVRQQTGRGKAGHRLSTRKRRP